MSIREIKLFFAFLNALSTTLKNLYNEVILDMCGSCRKIEKSNREKERIRLQQHNFIQYI